MFGLCSQISRFLSLSFSFGRQYFIQIDGTHEISFLFANAFYLFIYSTRIELQANEEDGKDKINKNDAKVWIADRSDIRRRWRRCRRQKSHNVDVQETWRKVSAQRHDQPKWNCTMTREGMDEKKELGHRFKCDVEFFRSLFIATKAFDRRFWLFQFSFAGAFQELSSERQNGHVTSIDDFCIYFPFVFFFFFFVKTWIDLSFEKKKLE